MENEHDNFSKEMHQGRTMGTFHHRDGKWISSVSGGLVSAIATILFIVIPVVNTWLANTKEISLAQIKNTAEQIEYITKRMQDSDKERDLYKSEMISCQQELRQLKLSK